MIRKISRLTKNALAIFAVAVFCVNVFTIITLVRLEDAMLKVKYAPLQVVSDYPSKLTTPDIHQSPAIATADEKVVPLEQAFAQRTSDIATADENTIPLQQAFSQSSSEIVSCNLTYPLRICPCSRIIEVLVPQELCSGADYSWQESLAWIKRIYGESTCGDMATLRGPHQKVVSYATYGAFPNGYFEGMDILVPRVSEVYPGWNVRIHLVLDISQEKLVQWVCKLVCQYPHLDVCDATKLPTLGDISAYLGSGWRFAPMGDPLIDWYMSRDSDSPILQREVDAVDSWLQSKKCFHTMRDNPLHFVSMMAGMWGGCGTWKGHHNFSAIRDKIIKNIKRKGQDQTQLTAHLWPIARKNATMHDSFTCARFPGSIPFPTQRQGLAFVGIVGQQKVFNWGITKQCPVKCRPKDHQDWKYC